MNNGCVCCTVRKDLIETFHLLFSDEKFSRLDWVVIETTGTPIRDALILIDNHDNYHDGYDYYCYYY